MPDEVGAVLVVVADDRRDRVLVEGAHLLGMRGEHAEQQPVGAGADVLRRSARRTRRRTSSTSSASWIARASSPGRRRRSRGPTVPWRRRRCGQLARARRASRSGASSPPDGRQQRVDAVLHVLRQRARVVAGDRRDDVARAVGASARRRARRRPRERSQPRRAGAPHDLARLEVGPRAQVLEERAAQVLLDLLAASSTATSVSDATAAAVQELGGRRRRRRSAAQQQDGADQLVAGRDRHLGDDLRRHLRRAGRAARSPT